jgi:hypothetical protein
MFEKKRLVRMALGSKRTVLDAQRRIVRILDRAAEIRRRADAAPRPAPSSPPSFST